MAFPVFDGFQPIDLSGPWQAFTTANDKTTGSIKVTITECA